MKGLFLDLKFRTKDDQFWKSNTFLFDFDKILENSGREFSSFQLKIFCKIIKIDCLPENF